MSEQSLKIFKIGGDIVDDEQKLHEFLDQFAAIHSPKILIHGGGKVASKMLRDLGMQPNMIGGRRITNQSTLDIITGVYAGQVNKKIVSKLQQRNLDALGLCGADGGTIKSTKRPIQGGVNYGFVGDIEKVSTTKINRLLNSGFTPVFCAISFSMEHGLLNTNADTVATRIAAAFSKENYHTRVELFYAFSYPGVMMDLENSKSIIPRLDRDLFSKGLQQGWIHEGMIPKLENALYATEHAVSKVTIGSWNDLLSNARGTEIVRNISLEDKTCFSSKPDMNKSSSYNL